MSFECPHCGKEINTCVKCGKIGDEYCSRCFPKDRTVYRLEGPGPKAMF